MLMSTRTALTGALLCALGVFTASCAARETSAPSALPPFPVPASASVPAAPAPQPVPQPDPAVELIALSTRHFETGQRELQQGHLDAAKAQFNEALEALLESPLGGRSEPSVREHFDRLVERISAY